MSYTKFPNNLIDEVMPNCSRAEWLLICAIIRKTNGFQKQKDTISISQFSQLSGISGRQHIIEALNSLIDKGIVLREKSGHGFAYSIPDELPNVTSNSNLTLPVILSDQLPNITSNGNVKLPKSVTLRYPQKKKETLKESIYTPPIGFDETALDTIGQYMLAISQQVKTPYHQGTINQFEDAAIYVFGRDATLDQVSGFGKWWDDNGFYAGKPALKSFLAEWDNYANGRSLKQATNGNGHNADASWDKVCQLVNSYGASRYGEWKHQLTDAEQRGFCAIGQDGWDFNPQFSGQQKSKFTGAMNNGK